MDGESEDGHPIVEDASTVVIELLARCPNLTTVHLKNIAGSSAALAKLAGGASWSSVEDVDFETTLADWPTSVSLLAKMPSLELLGIHVDASDDRAMVATEFSSNDGTRLLLSQLVLLLPPEEDQAERICVDVVALTDPLHLLRLSIFNIRTETELWSSASFSNLRSLRPYSHIGDFLADLLDFFVQLSCLRKLDLYNYRPSRLEPCKDSLVQSVLRTFPPSLVEGCLERLLFPLSEQQYLKHVPAADAPGEARFFCFMVYKKEAHDKAATVPSADAADDES